MDKTYSPRKLAERSFLQFLFPTTNGGYIQANIPMLENADISESGKARYSEYQLLSRNGNLYAYTGSDSRNLTVKFNITLPNIIDYINREGLDNKFKTQFKVFYLNKEDQKKIFLSTPLSQAVINTTTKSANNMMKQAEIAREYFEKITNKRLGVDNGGITTSIAEFVVKNILGDSFEANPNAKSISQFDKIVDLLIFWINLIRASTLNNSSNTSLGPPIVRLNHGILYNNIPCVCKNYSIKPLQEYGYDLATFTSRVIEVNLTLEETRTGNFDKYIPSKFIDGDNVAGWESIISTGTMDPYTGPWPLTNTNSEGSFSLNAI